MFQLYRGENMLHYNDVHLVLEQHTELDFYSASPLKQQSVGKHVAPLGHIVQSLSQPVFVVTS